MHDLHRARQQRSERRRVCGLVIDVDAEELEIARRALRRAA